MKIFNMFKRKSKLETKNTELKYFCDKCSKELSFEMYQTKKCFWCDSKSKPVIVKEIDKTPTNIKDLNSMLIQHNWNSLNNFYKRKEERLTNGTYCKKKKSSK